MKIKVISLPVEEMKLRGGSVSVRNLAVGAEDVDGVRALTVGRRFRQLTDKVLQPLSEGHFCSGGSWLLLTDEADNLYVMRDGIPEIVGRAPDKVSCAVAFDSGWHVMTESSRLTVRRDGDKWQVERDRFAEPVIYFTAVGHGTLHQSVEAMTLGDVDFSRTGSEISARDTANVTAKLLEAYSELTRKAADAGLRLQPVLAQAELIDSAGRVIYTSLPRLVGSGSGWQCCAPVSAQCSKPSATELAVPSMMLSAEAYGVGVRVETLGSYASEASALRVTLTPQDHPVSYDQQALCRIVHPATPTPTLTVALPGTTASWADKTAVRAERLRSLFDRFEMLKSHTVTVAAGCGDCGEPGFSHPLPAEADTVKIEKAVARDVTASAEAASMKDGYEQGFIAGCVAECGDTVVWGDLTQVRSLAAITYGSLAEDADIEWSGTLRLTHADGSVTDRLLGYPDRCPLSLSALTAYPDADVTRIDVWVHNLDTSTIGHAGCNLRPSADGTCAVSVTADLHPIELKSVSEYPETTETSATLGRRRPGAVLVARSDQPLMPVTSLEITPARISALSPAVRAQSLDAARTKLYAFSPVGIFNITLPVSRKSATATLLDRRGAADAPVTFTPEGVYFIDRDGAMRRVSGSKIERLPLKSRIVSMARDGVTGRLLALDCGGKMFALDAATTARYQVGLPSPALSLTDIAGQLYLTAQTGLYTLDGAVDMTDVEYIGRVALSYPSSIVAIEVKMAASRFKGKIALGTDGGPGPEYSLDLSRFDLDTAVNGRLITRVAAPSLSYATVTVKGDVTPDFRLTEVSLILCRPL